MSCSSCHDETRDCYACSLRERIVEQRARAENAEHLHAAAVLEVERLRAALERIASSVCSVDCGCCGMDGRTATDALRPTSASIPGSSGEST